MTAAIVTDDCKAPRVPAQDPLPKSTVRWYGMGQAAEGIKNYAFASCLLFYYTSVLGLSGSLAGAALMVALAFDAVTDPMVAVLSDRTRSRWGRRHPYLFLSALPLGLFFYLVFVPPEDLAATLHLSEQWALFGWLVLFAVLTRASMTLFHVPHMALGAELTDDFDERTRVVTSRSIASVIGTTLVVAGYFLLLAAMQSTEYPDVRLNPLPYSYFAALFGVIMVLVVFSSAWGTRDRIPLLRDPDAMASSQSVLASMLRDMREALSLRSFRALFFGFTLCYLGFGVTTALGTHNALYFWHVSIETQGLLGITVVCGSLGGMAFWKKVAERTDKKPTFLAGLSCFMVFSAPPLLLKAHGIFPAEDSPVYVPTLMAISFLYSFGIASAMVVVGSMMADITDEDELKFGRQREGIFFGALSFATKAAGGLGIVIAGAAYDFVGLYKGLDPADASAEISQMLGLISGGVILTLVGLSFIIFIRYDLTRERHAGIRASLDAARSRSL
ncbi:MAG: MFS transporter [Deltaproteobacteria bacterium]|nr:MFS transporter [Deltaproteobacteria bacterium]